MKRCKRCGRKLKNTKAIECGYGSHCNKIKDVEKENKLKIKGWFE